MSRRARNRQAAESAIFALAMVSASASACTVGAHIGTYHTDNSRSYDNFNPGAYVNCNGPTAGAYHNSLGRLSAYAGWTFKAFGPIEATAGVITGYGKPMPMLIPTVRASHIRIAFVPPNQEKPGSIHFMWEF